MKIYYAHHMWKYNTQEELDEIESIEREFDKCTIINPNGDIVESGDDEYAMEQCFNLVKGSNTLVFTTLPDKTFGKGVYDEVALALSLKIPVYILDKGIFSIVDSLGSISKIVVSDTKTNRKYAQILV
ncbi:MAG: hypothetical protein RSC24_06780 [Clostridium sp.]